MRDTRYLDPRIRRKAIALVQLEDHQRRAKAIVAGKGWRLRAGKPGQILLFQRELRELLIREASFELWRKWWPMLPEPHLRKTIGQCSLAVLLYCAHQRLGHDLRMWWTL